MGRKGKVCFNSPTTECPQYVNTKCIVYTGASLSCIGVHANDRLEAILSKINDAICSSSGTTFIEGGNLITVTGVGTQGNPYTISCDITSNDISRWEDAYSNQIVSASFSGTTNKTLTLVQQDGGTITATFNDLSGSSSFINSVSSTATITLTVTVDDLTANLIVGGVDNTQNNIVVWNGTSLMLRTASSITADETSNRISADNVLANSISILSAALSIEVVNRTSADSQLSLRIDAISGTGSGSVTSQDFSVLSARVAFNSADNTSSEAALSARIDAISGVGSVTSQEFSALSARVDSNSANQTSIDAALSSRIDSVSNSLSAETSSRIAEDSALSTAISALSQQLSLQVSALSQAVSIISNALSAEIASRISADNALSGRIDTASNAVSIVSVAQATTSADLTSVKNTISILSQSVSVLSQAVSAISVRVDTISNATSIVSAAQAVTSADLTSVKNVISQHSQAISVLSQQISVLSNNLSANSVVLSNTRSAVIANSAQMTSADNAISNAISVLSTIVSNQSSAIIANSAQMISLVSNLSVQLSLQISAMSQALSTKKLISLADVSVSTVTDGQVLMWKSVSAQWVNSSVAVGTGSVTSQKLSVAIAVETSNRISADNALSTRIDTQSQSISVLSQQLSVISQQVSVLSNNLSANSVVLSNAVSAIVANSADVTSLKNVVSNLSVQLSLQVSALSQVHSALSANVATISLNVSAISTRLSALSTQVTNNSAQMTSADNDIRSVVSVLSSDLTSVKNAVSVLSQSVSVLSQTVSAISVRMDTISNAVSVVSQSLSVLSQNVSAMSARVDTVSNAVSIVSNALSANSVVLSNTRSAVIANSAQMTSADNDIRSVVSVLSALVSNQGSAIVANSAQMVSLVSNLSVQLSLQVSALSQAVSLKNPRITIMDEGVTVVSSPTAFDFVGTGIQVSVSGAKVVVSVATGSVTSDELSAVSAAAASSISIVSAALATLSLNVSALSTTVNTNSAQMTSADNAISNAISVLSTVVSNQGSAIVANSAQMVSLVSNLSVQLSLQISAMSQALSAKKLISLADVSVSSVADGQVIMWKSASGQWVNSSVAAGTGSVTSTELSAAVAVETSNRISADNALSNAISVLSAAARGPEVYIVAANDTPALIKATADYICDGTADESEINTALALGDVQLCPGTYNTAAAISMPSNRSLRGVGKNTLITSSAVTGGKFITNSGTEGIVISDLSIDGNDGAVGYGMYFELLGSGTGASAIQGARVENVWITNVAQSGIDFRSCANSIVDKVNLLNEFNTGVAGNYNYFDGVICRQLAASPRCTGIRITNCIAHNCTAAVWVQESDDIQVTNNYFTGQADNGKGQLLIQIESNSTNFLVDNNICIGGVEANIYVDTCVGGTISNNICDGTVSNSIAGLNLSGASHILIEGNTVINSAAEGIATGGGGNNKVIGNYVHSNGTDANNTYYGIMIGGADDSVTGNTVRKGSNVNKQSYGLRILSGATRAFVEGNDFYDSGVTGDINNSSTTALIRRNKDINGRWHEPVTITSATSVLLGTNNDLYVFNGSVATVFHVPTVSGTAGKAYIIKNRSTSAAITLSIVGGGAELYDTSPLSGYSVNPGEALIIKSDGVFYNLIKDTGTGTGSVTSTELSAAVAVETSNRISADDVLSNSISALSVQLSLQVSALSQVHSALSANVATISLNVSALSTRLDTTSNNLSQNSVVLSNAVSAIVANSAQMVSLVSNLSVQLSLQVSALSQVHSALSANVATISLNISAISTRLDTVSNNLSQNSVVLSNAVSAIAANSAQMVSLVSNLSVQLSLQISALSQAHSVLSTLVSNHGSAIAANSADVTSVKAQLASVQSVLSAVSAQLPINAVRLAITTNITPLTSVTSVIDGQSAAGGDRVLLAGQTSLQENGIYLWSTTGYTRAPDMNNTSVWDKDFPGRVIQVLSGTTFGGKFFVVSAPFGGTVNTTSVGINGPYSNIDGVSAINAVSNNLSQNSVVLSNAVSAIQANSAQMVSLVSNLSVQLSLQVSALSQVHSALSANVATISLNVSALSTRLSALSTQVTNNSAQMTSADNAISAAAASKNPTLIVLSADVTVLSSPTAFNFTGGGVQVSVSGTKAVISIAAGGSGSVTSTELSAAVAVETSNRVSADNALSNLISALSATLSTTASALSQQISALSVVVSNEISARNALSVIVSNTNSAVAANSAQMVSLVSNLSVQLSLQVSALSQAVSLKNPRMTIMDEGVTVVSSPTAFDFVGGGIQVSVSGTKVVVSVASGGGSGNPMITILDEGVSLLSGPTTFDFVGAGVQVSVSGTKATISIGSGGSGSVTSDELSVVNSVASVLKFMAVESVSAAGYTISAGDHLKMKYFTTAVAISVTLPNGLASGFQCMIYRAAGAGPITLSAATSVEALGLSINTAKTGVNIINKGSDLWVAVGALGNGPSVTSANFVSAISSMSTAVSALSVQLSLVASALSTGILKGADAGLIHIVANAQGISATTLGSANATISGLSITFVNNAIYQIHAHVLYSVSGTTSVVTKFAISSPGAVVLNGVVFGDLSVGGGGGGFAITAQAAGGAFNFASSGGGNTLVWSAGSAQVALGPVHCWVLDALVVSAVAGSFQLMAITGGATSPITIIPGSFIKAYRLA